MFIEVETELEELFVEPPDDAWLGLVAGWPELTKGEEGRAELGAVAPLSAITLNRSPTPACSPAAGSVSNP